METISHDGIEYTVREVARPDGWMCRLLVSDDGANYFLEYLVSVGPYKIDVARIHRLDAVQVSAWHAGSLRLGALAHQLTQSAEPDEDHPNQPPG